MSRSLLNRALLPALRLAIGASLLVAVSPELASSFTPGQVFWAPGYCTGPCELFDVTMGGDFASASGFATIARSPGQIAWSADGTTAYVSEYFDNRVSAVSETGVVTPFATGIPRPTGLLRASDGRILVASFSDRAVYDISGGVLSAVPFASGLSGPRNLLQLATGEILIADQYLGGVLEITDGGDFTGDTPFASGLDGPFDLLQDGSGKIYASSFLGVFDITAGGDFTSASAHAGGRAFFGLALGAGGTILATEFNTGEIFDVTAPGDYSGASSFAQNLPGLGETSLDTVPAISRAPPISTPSVPMIGGGMLGALGALLLVTSRLGPTSPFQRTRRFGPTRKSNKRAINVR